MPKRPPIPTGYGPLKIPGPVGRVYRMEMDHCIPDPLTYLETTVEAALRIGISEATPDFKEVYHKVIGRSLQCSVEGALHDAFEGTKIAENCLSRAFFRLAGAVDTAAYLIWATGVAGSFLSDWTSMLYRRTACEHPYGRNAGYAGSCYGASFDRGQWSTMASWNIVNDSIWSPVWPSVYFATSDGFLSLGWAAQGTMFNGIPIAYATRFIDSTTGEVLISGQNDPSECCPSGWSIAANTKVPIKRGHRYDLQGMTPMDVPKHEVFPRYGTLWIALTRSD